MENYLYACKDQAELWYQCRTDTYLNNTFRAGTGITIEAPGASTPAMIPPSIVGADSASASTIPVPGTIAVGDLIFISFRSDANNASAAALQALLDLDGNALTVGNGWTVELFHNPVEEAILLRKFATVTEVAALNVNYTGGGTTPQIGIGIFRGVQTITVGTLNTGNDTNPVAAGLNPMSVANSLVFHMGLMDEPFIGRELPSMASWDEDQNYAAYTGIVADAPSVVPPHNWTTAVAGDWITRSFQLGGFAGNANQSCCGCCDAVFVDPITDNVCWYDSSRPESAEFLGFLPDPVDGITGLHTGAYGRSLETRFRGGHMTQRREVGREIEVTGKMYATSCAGMDYGLAYLQDALDGCGTCPQPSEFSYTKLCGPSGDTQDLRTIKNVGLIDGIEYEAIDEADMPICFISQVTFTIGAEWPFHYLAPVSLLDETAGAIPYTGSFTYTTPRIQRTATFQIIIDNSMGTVPVEGIYLIDRNYLNACPPTIQNKPRTGAEFTVKPGDRIMFDGTTRRVYGVDSNDCPQRLRPDIARLNNGSRSIYDDTESCEEVCGVISITAGDAINLPSIRVNVIEREKL